jgi:ribose transport system permease protein
VTAALLRPWIWAWTATILVWSITIAATGGSSAGGLTQAAFTFAAFSVIVGLGQMFVITLGPGNIDLSVPATMTLAGTVSLKFMAEQNGLIVPGLAIALAIGAGIGIANYALITMLRIPPIIATLAVSFIVQSTAIWTNRGLRIKPPSWLADASTGTIWGVPNVAITAGLLTIGAWVLLERSPFGRRVTAIGQSMAAARMASVPVDGVRLATYVLCATMAGLCGYLLASFSGGAALNMGAEFLLTSIAVVIIGGCSVAGGNSNVPGIWGAALFLFLVVSMLNTYGFGAGPRLILTGFIIIAVILAASARRIETR